MTRIAALLLPLSLAQGCIIYENNGDQDFSSGDWWNGGDDTASGEDSPADAYAVGWQVYPPSAAPGDILLVTFENTTDLDLLFVTDVDFGDGFTVHDRWFDETELMVVIEVAADAAPGAHPIEVTLADGSVVTIDQEFLVEGSDSGGDTGGGDTGGCN